MTSYIDDVALSIGVSGAQLKLILLLFLSIPLSLVFPYLPQDPSPIPHLFAALPTIFYLWTVLNLRDGFFHLLASSLVTYFIVKNGVKNKEGSKMPWKVFAVVMGHLTVNHIIRHISKTPVEEIEITGSQMVLVMKLISFAWSVYDGQRPDAELDPTQRASKISEVPGLIPFFGYCLFFPSILAGPAFTYSSYRTFVTRALFAKELKHKQNKSVKEISIIPAGRRRKAAKRAITGIVYLAVYAFYGSKISYWKMLEPEFAHKSFAYKFFFMNLSGFVCRTKYYAVWCIAESAFIVSGLGFNPVTKKYDASRNVRIRSIELAPNFKILLDSWNMNTNVWLRECIYKRVTKPGKKPGFKSTQITFITSALWHGINPCYLLTFVLGGFYQSLGRSLRALVRPFFLPPAFSPAMVAKAASTPAPSAPPTPAPSSPALSGAGTSTPPITKPAQAGPFTRPSFIPPPQTPLKWTYDIIGIIATQSALNFIVVPFILLGVRPSFAAWHVVYYYGIFLVAIPMLALNLGLAGVLKRQLKIRDAKWEKKVSEEEREMEVERIKWEKREEEKRIMRGEGVASMGLDVEKMAEEEEKVAKEKEKVPEKEL
ncbi:MBOAT-domain-containing protein [Meredithblackwellia eburnea MCA 4105]